MNKIVLIPNPTKDDGFRVARRVIYRLRSKGAKVYVDKKYTELHWEEVEFYTTPPKQADLCIVMGGDGSFLNAAPYAIKHQIPLLGINLGRIGFLSVIEPERITQLDKLFTKKIPVVERLLLSLSVRKTNGEVKTYERLALNEVLIKHKVSHMLSEFSMSDSHGNSIQYRADGLILSTPTGSSAYSLSAGGPLIETGVEALCATPICAHSFFNRPVLFGPQSVITVRNTSERGAKMVVCIDGQETDVLQPGDEAVVTVSDKHLLTFDYPNNGLLNTLRRKMEAAELRRDT